MAPAPGPHEAGPLRPVELVFLHASDRDLFAAGMRQIQGVPPAPVPEEQTKQL